MGLEREWTETLCDERCPLAGNGQLDKASLYEASRSKAFETCPPKTLKIVTVMRFMANQIKHCFLISNTSLNLGASILRSPADSALVCQDNHTMLAGEERCHDVMMS
jgi:hypothetical protein